MALGMRCADHATASTRKSCGRSVGIVRLRTKATDSFIIIILSGVRLSPLGTAATIDPLHQPQMIDYGDCGIIGELKNGRVKRSTRRKPEPMSLCPPQIPHDLTRSRTRAAAVGSQRLTAWAMARPSMRFSGTIPVERRELWKMQTSVVLASHLHPSAWSVYFSVLLFSVTLITQQYENLSTDTVFWQRFESDFYWPNSAKNHSMNKI
jgi:hypothetical protein